MNSRTQTLESARDLARKESVIYTCTKYINMYIGYDEATDQYGAKGFLVSDWQGDTTVESFYNGNHQRYTF
jgi:hypothetical protein